MPSMLTLGVLALSLSAGDAKLMAKKPTLSGLVEKQLVSGGVSPELLAAVKGQKPIKTKSELMDRIREHVGVRGRNAGECNDMMMDPNALSSCGGEEDLTCGKACDKDIADLVAACDEPGEDTSSLMAGMTLMMAGMMAMMCDPCMQSFMIIEDVCGDEPTYDDYCGKGACADAVSDISKCDFSEMMEMMEMFGSSSTETETSSDMSMSAALEMMGNMCSGCTGAMLAAGGDEDEDTPSVCEEFEDGDTVSEDLCSADCFAAYITVDANCKDEDLAFFDMTDEDIAEMRGGVADLTGACEAGGFEVPEPGDMGAAPGASFLAALC